MAKGTESTWLADVSIPSYQPLAEDISTDVAVVGGGITGILTAYQLAKRGYSVALFEKDRVLRSATGYTTAFITASIDTDTADLIEMLGKERARLVWDTHADAIDELEQIAADEGIECEFMRVPNYLYANDRKEMRALKEEYAAMRRLRIRANLMTAPIPGFLNEGAIVMPNQAKYHPLKFLVGILARLSVMGVRIYEKTEVTTIEKKTKVKLAAGKHAVTANWSVLATYGTDDHYKQLYFKKGMYKTYLLELSVPAEKLPEGIFEDCDNPYHYFRVDRGEKRDRVLLGGEDHRMEIKMQEDTNFDALCEYANRLIGTDYEVVRRWSGGILEPLDGLAYIGEVAPRQLVATSFSGNGMTYGAIASLLLADIVEGKKNPWKALYDPKRTPNLTQLWKKGRDYSEEFFRGAVANALKHGDRK